MFFKADLLIRIHTCCPEKLSGRKWQKTYLRLLKRAGPACSLLRCKGSSNSDTSEESAPSQSSQIWLPPRASAYCSSGNFLYRITQQEWTPDREFTLCSNDMCSRLIYVLDKTLQCRLLSWGKSRIAAYSHTEWIPRLLHGLACHTYTPILELDCAKISVYSIVIIFVL